MTRKLLAIFGVLSLAIPSSACTAAKTSKDGITIDGEYFPGPNELRSAAKKCGLNDENFKITIDDQGVANIDIVQGEMSANEYTPKMDCFLEWTARNNAAASFQAPKDE